MSLFAVIYLDNNATTRVLPEILEAMLPFYTELWGNPSSLHQFGAQVAPHLDKAREQVAKLIEAQRANEITFTSGGTESTHLAILGTLKANPIKKHVVTSQVEHSSVSGLCQSLEKEGYDITYIGVDSNGNPDLKQLEAATKKETVLVSIMWANNETGVLFPIEEVATICDSKNITLHVDATQAVGKIPIDLRKAPVHLLSISGHKFHAPKGIGALFVRRGKKINPLVLGGHQERGRRAGTENVAGIVGLGKAAELAQKRISEKIWRSIEILRDQFEEKIIQKFPWTQINGKNAKRLPNTSSLSFEGLNGEAICLLLSEEGIAASTGSACSAGTLEPSHVLKAMGLNTKKAKGTIRISLSFETTQEEMEQVAKALEKIIQRLASV